MAKSGDSGNNLKTAIFQHGLGQERRHRWLFLDTVGSLKKVFLEALTIFFSPIGLTAGVIFLDALNVQSAQLPPLTNVNTPPVRSDLVLVGSCHKC